MFVAALTELRTNAPLQDGASAELRKVEVQADGTMSVAAATKDDPAVMALHSELFVKMQDALTKLWSAGVRAFPRNGMLLAAVREHGFMPFEHDSDFLVLEEDMEKLKTADLSPFYMSGNDLKPDFDGWPLLSFKVAKTEDCGVPFTPNADGLDKIWSENSGAEESTYCIPRATFDAVEEVPFYCGTIKVFGGYDGYLTHLYGSNWKSTAYNKCSKDGGELYKTNPDHCTMGCYHWGSMDGRDYPHESTPVAAPIDESSGCKTLSETSWEVLPAAAEANTSSTSSLW